MAQTDRNAGLVANAAFKLPCRVATTANITLSGTQTIDGVAVVADDRVLVKDQTDDTENGIYEVDSGTWSRTKDFNGAYDVKKGTIVYITDGTAGTGLFFASDVSDPTFGTTSITFTQVFTFANLTVTSSFTSPGIDDNATAENLQLADDLLTLGQASTDFNIVHVGNDSSIKISGGSGGASGANLRLFGGAAARAGDFEFRDDSTVIFNYDKSDSEVTISTPLKMGGNVVSDTDSTDDLGTTSVRWANLYVDSIGDSGQALSVANDLTFTNANPEIIGGDTDGVLTIGSSTAITLGSNIRHYGDTHATKANDTEIRSGTGVELHYDDDASLWDFQANAITTTGALTSGAITTSDDLTFTNANPNILGGDSDGALAIYADDTVNQGANIVLYGNTHATLANDIRFRVAAADELRYDDDASSWDFQSNKVYIGDDVHIGGTSPLARLHVVDTGTAQVLELETDTGGVIARFSCTAAEGATAGPNLRLSRDSGGNGASGNVGGQIQFHHPSDAGTLRELARLKTTIDDASDGSEYGSLTVSSLVNGSIQTVATFGSATAGLMTLNLYNDLRIDAAQTTGTASTQTGYITVDIGGTTRYIATYSAVA